MLDISRDIHSLSHFKRNTLEFIRQLKETGAPAVLTVNGKAELVVQDAVAYQKLLELVDQLETREAIRRGIESADRGEGRPAEEFFAEMERKYNIPRDV
jgi:PHD/YefM family antitoxin component YafN of YafNO toxin-antitoxin module